MSTSFDYSTVSGLKLVAFDLDGTIWDPEMYQLWGGGGPPFRVAPNGVDLIDANNTVVRLLGLSSQILDDIKHNSDLCEPKIAWVSRCDEPEWANACLHLFVTQPGRVPLSQIADSSEIYHANKQVHFRNLKKQFPDIDYSEMLFYDNQMDNIQAGAKLGVKCVFCPDGMTAEAWEQGLQQFR